MLVGMLINGLDHGPEKPMDQNKTMTTNAFALFTCVTAVMFTPCLIRRIAANKNHWRGRFWAFVDGFVGLLPYYTVSLGSGAMVCHLLDVHPATMTSIVKGRWRAVWCSCPSAVLSKEADAPAAARAGRLNR